MPLLSESITYIQKSLYIFSLHDALELLCCIGLAFWNLTQLNKRYSAHQVYAVVTLILAGALALLHGWHAVACMLCITLYTVLKSATAPVTALPPLEPATQLPTYTKQRHWIDELIALTLQAMNRGQKIVWLIEYEAELSQLLQPQVSLYTPLATELIEIILAGADYHKPRILWINKKGILIGIEPQFISANEKNHIRDEIALHKKVPSAIIVTAQPEARTYALYSAFKVHERLSLHHLTVLLKNLFQEQIPIPPVAPPAEPAAAQSSKS